MQEGEGWGGGEAAPQKPVTWAVCSIKEDEEGGVKKWRGQKWGDGLLFIACRDVEQRRRSEERERTEARKYTSHAKLRVWCRTLRMGSVLVFLGNAKKK